MKIAMVSRYPQDPTKPPGGVESMTVSLAEALAQVAEGSVTVFTLERDRSRLGEKKVGDVSVRRLLRSPWPMILDVCCGPSRRRLETVLDRMGPSIVHFHETWGLGAVPSTCPQVFTVHGFDSVNIPVEGGRFAGLRSKMWATVEKRGFAKAKHIISISPYVTRQIRPLTNAMIHEIDKPVDLSFFSVNRNEEPGRVLCVGWINPRKNTLMSVRAFAKSFQVGRARKLVVAGVAIDEAYMVSVQAEIARLGLRDAVEFAGQINREQLRAELSRAAVLLLPSLQEDAPMAVAEAMAIGVPVITSNRCGMPYMVEDGRSGFLVEPTYEAQIVEKLNRVLGDEELRCEMGARGRQIANERFHPAEVARKTMRVYQSVIEERTRIYNGVTAKPVGILG